MRISKQQSRTSVQPGAGLGGLIDVQDQNHQDKEKIDGSQEMGKNPMKRHTLFETKWCAWIEPNLCCQGRGQIWTALGGRWR